MILHHPSDATLTAYAAGSLPEALAVVVQIHLADCHACGSAVAMIEQVGGALLDAMEPAPMAGDALHRVMRRSGTLPPGRFVPGRETDLPFPLNHYTFGRWWPIGLGLRWRPMKVAGRAWAGLLRAEPGRALWRHQHTGLELTCVLRGSFIDNGKRFGPGDIAEPDGHGDHQPTTDGTDPCICVMASEGMQLNGALGVIQRLLGR